MVGQALGSAEVPARWETVRVGEGWRTAERATLEVCLGTEMGQLSSVHLDRTRVPWGLGGRPGLVWERDRHQARSSRSKFSIYRNKRTPELKSREFWIGSEYLLGI